VTNDGDNLKNIARKLWQNKMLASFAIVWAITLAVLLIVNNRTLVYDSLVYVGLSFTFTLDGGFSFLNFPESFRGYFFPFCLFVAGETGNLFFRDYFIGMWLFYATLLSAISCVLLPRLLELVTGGVERRLAFYFAPAALVWLFWRGTVLYPDSDLPALCFMLMATLFLYMAGKAPLRAAKTNLKGVFLYFLAGFFAYGAYNTRTIYLFSALGLVLIYAYLCHKRKPARLDIALSLLILAAGVAAASWPQLIINMNTQGVPSIAVITTYFAAGTNLGTNLSVSQMYTGSGVWLYETYIGPSAVYPVPGVRVLDPIVKTYAFPEADSVFAYAKLVFTHPWEFAGIYFRHFIAALIPVFGEAYISDLLKPKVFLIFANCLLMFATCLGFLSGMGANAESGGKKAYYRRAFAKYLPFYPLLLPCLAILPSAMEVRFMLPCYVLMYGLLAYAFDYRKIAALLKSRPLTCAAALLLLFVFCLSTYQTIWANAEYALNMYPMR
jgi:hypothetical protein